MYTHVPSRHQIMEVHGFKWPHRPTAVAHAVVLGTDAFGQWLGVTKGSAWRRVEPSESGTFDHSFVKLIPYNTFWSVCFHPTDPVVDVDIILPVTWIGDRLEEVDLELDVLRTANGNVWVRDQDIFTHVRTMYSMPSEIAVQAEQTCTSVRALVAEACEPFGSVGFLWLAYFLRMCDDK